MTKKKIRYSDFTVPTPPPLTRFTPVSTPAIAPNVPVPAPPAPAVPAPSGVVAETASEGRGEAPRPRRISAPVDIARALAAAQSAEASDVAAMLAEVEARAAAAHARELAEAEAAAGAPVAPTVSATPIAAPERGVRPRADETADDEDDEDELDDRWDDDDHAEARGARRPLRERARGRSGLAELLMFRVGTERFAVELLCVEEAIDLPEVHHVPEMPPAMLGVITVRGSLTPVFTPHDALGVPAEGKSAALIFRSDRGRFALAIDDVDDVMTLDLAQLRDAPGIDGTDAVVLGVTRNGGGIVALVDADALVAACQATPVPELV